MKPATSSVFENQYKKLNPEQKKAVDATQGPVMVIAGPGSGKTEVLGMRVANILRTQDVAPANILCLTFTDAAAFNMRKRLVGLIGGAAYRVAIHTFHSFGVEIINRYPERFYNGAALLPADSVTQTEILEGILVGLEHNNPLRAQHNDKFVFLSKILKAIEYLKKAGISPEEFKKILALNSKSVDSIDPIIQKVFSERVSKKIFEQARAAAEKIRKIKTTPLPGVFHPLPEHIGESLIHALNESEESDSTAPLTRWKGKNVRKDEDATTHIVDKLNSEKFEALAYVYEQYRTRMREEGYFDYNDMILDTITMLENSIGVRYDLQERYQYVLVDEFQDTNNAQMKLLYLLTDHPVHEGRPNIMVVGDDDQAIFKFQGAEISNIRDFQRKYKDSQLVVLKENYRSNQLILNAASNVIVQNSNRLEKIIPNLKKELVAAGGKREGATIRGKEFTTREAEYQWIVREVRRLKENGVPAKEIAVIAREHASLEALVPYFHGLKIPLLYEREENVLREAHILQLVTMARFVDSIMKKTSDADELLPEILSYPFWEIDRSVVWELSVRAGSVRKPWLFVMRESGGKLREIADFFIDLGAKARYATSEEILHELIGGPQIVLGHDDTEDAETFIRHEMFSPFRSYYFGKDHFNKNRAVYLKFLSSLQSFIRSVREYRRGQPVTVGDMVEFVDMHVKNNLPINNVSQFVNGEDAVHFLTAHKAKGLEFEVVFVINCENDVWADEGGNRNFPLPSNLPITPAGEDRDDQLRLFYVAITRAKHVLYFTSRQIDHVGKPVDRLAFLVPSEKSTPWLEVDVVDIQHEEESPEDLLAEQWRVRHIGPFTADEKALLKPVLEKYQLSVTHLQNFLNLVDAGPIIFLEKNLLLFPEPKTANSAFGSAVHGTIKRIYSFLKSSEKLPTDKLVFEWFEEYLTDERLNDRDFKRMSARGKKLFTAFYHQKKESFTPTDIIEFNFKDQGVMVGAASLTGKIDRMSIVGDDITVTDFKTSKPLLSWDSSGLYEKISAWKYQLQLTFYKLLIEGSRDFGNRKPVRNGIIEFVEPHQGKIIDLLLEITSDDAVRLRSLIEIVYKKIQALDFPDVGRYSKDLKGIRSFEEDLLNGRI